MTLLQVAEDKTKGPLQVPCSLGMNIVVTFSISNAEKESKRLNNVKIHQVYIKYQRYVLPYFSVGVQSNYVNLLPVANYCHKEFHKHHRCFSSPRDLSG